MNRIIAVSLLAIVLAACNAAGNDPQLTRGRQVFTEHCSACHSVVEEVVIVGPSLAGLASRSASDEIRSAILDPDEVLTEGFDNLMPPDFAQKISEENLDALMAYLLTLN